MSSAPPTPHTARVVGNRDAAGVMRLVSLALPDEVRATYVRPGQYVHVSLDGESGYFALGNREGTAPWEILLRRGGGVADLLFDARDNLEVKISSALGAGFPVESARGQDVVVVVTAGAFAAARATVARRIVDGDAQRTHLLVGARTIETVPMRDEMDRMRAAGIGVRVVLSRNSNVIMNGDARYVHHVLAEVHDAHAWIFIAGAGDMIADVRATARSLAVPAERVVSNV